MNNLYRKIMHSYRLIKKKILKLRRMLTTNPFKVAEIWRKLGVPIGNNTCIYRDVVISGDGDEPVFIGENCVLTGCALLAHDASTNRQLGINYGQSSITRPIIIEDNCFIGYGAIVLMGVTIGHDSIVGAGSIVTKDVPPRSVLGGNPAKIICTTDKLVDKRRQFINSHPE
jgi:acetyltransferase-like isoleucine patch superfamily enzyme